MIFCGCYLANKAAEEETDNPETEIDAGSSGDTDADTDTGTSTGDVEDASTDTDTDTDTDTNTDTDSSSDTENACVDPNYQYSTSCNGDLCFGPDDCCADAECGATHYGVGMCLPACNTASPNPSGCACGDICFQLDGWWTEGICVVPGRVVINDLSVTMWDFGYFPVGDIREPLPAASIVEAQLDGEALPFQKVFGRWSHEDIHGTTDWENGHAAIHIFGETGPDSFWFLRLYIPESEFVVGDWKPMGNPWYTGFFSDLLFVVGDFSSSQISELSFEAQPTQTSTFRIDAVGVPCDSDEPCVKAQLDLNFDLAALGPLTYGDAGMK